MSYCRLSSPVPELTPDVDLSFEKIMELMKQGGYTAYEKYKNDNGVITSDAYVYESCYGGFMCHWSKHANREDVSTDTPGEMAEILIEAVKGGVRVPQSAIDALLEEEEEWEDDE